MRYSELTQLVNDSYGPALTLRQVLPKARRDAIRKGALVGCVMMVLLIALLYCVEISPVGALPQFAVLASAVRRIYGVFLLLLALAFVISSLEAFHRSYYFRGLRQIIEEHTPTHLPQVSWEVATLIDDARTDMLASFLESRYGQEVFFRAGVTEQAFTSFVDQRRASIEPSTFEVNGESYVTLPTYAHSLYRASGELRHFLGHERVSETDFVDAAAWVEDIEHEYRLRSRWWSRDNLGRISGIGKTWAYGETYLLERYGHDLTRDVAWFSSVMNRHQEADEVEKIETVLARGRQTNVLVVAHDEMDIRERVIQLYHKIREGKVLPQLEAKRIFTIDVEAIVASQYDKASFERVFQSVMQQAVEGGNIILYLEHFADAVQSVGALGVDLVLLLQAYFEAPSLCLIVATTEAGYRTVLARDTRMLQGCDVIEMHDIDAAGLLSVLEERALRVEHRSGIAFTMPAVRSLMELAERYFPAGRMPDKAFDLLEELVPHLDGRGITQVLRSHVEEFVRGKTGVPIGALTSEERTKLLSLEDFLHRRVVGQEQAVSAVARALRRARAGVEDLRRPMGSFLFLGPTGVGKTETAKALAESLFGNEYHMLRFDMSEYQGPHALEELLGTPGGHVPGRLATQIEQRQYGVLLLDEFEKSDRQVHDLFLQILDEGCFTDATGKSINARNLIIIATSNAGADRIWEWEKQGVNILEQKRAFIDYLISTGLYRPELLNRFDDVIMFHPLAEDHVRSIARSSLDAFARKLASEQGITLTVTDDLVAALSKVGFDPQLGGRPLKRALQDTVEQIVADRMLAGTIAPGDTVTIVADDIMRAHLS